MKSIVRKTKDNSGVTIIMALLFMPLCVLVSTVLLATAGTASRDISRQRDQQKAYLAVSSAIDFIKNDICNCKYQLDPEVQVMAVSSDKEREIAFSNLLKEVLQAPEREEGSVSRSFGLTVPGYSELNVRVNFTMDVSDGITVTCESNSEGLDAAYKMTAHFRKDTFNEDSSWDTWELSSVSKGG